MKKRIRWLRISYWAGAIGDFAVAICALVPGIMEVPFYCYPMGGFSAVAFSWGCMRIPMFLATVLWSMSVPMFLAARGQIISLSLMSNRYMNAIDETMKAAYLASAELAIEIQSIYSYMALILLSVASIVIGLVMLKGSLGKRIGYLVIAAGILTLFTPLVTIGIPIIIPLLSIVLGAVWQLVVGFKLYRLGKDA